MVLIEFTFVGYGDSSAASDLLGSGEASSAASLAMEKDIDAALQRLQAVNEKMAEHVTSAPAAAASASLKQKTARHGDILEELKLVSKAFR